MLSQRTEKWFADRCGKITASRLGDVLLVSENKWKVLRPTGTTFKVCDNENDATAAMETALEKAKVKEGWLVSYVPGAPLEGFKNYMAEVVCERLTGQNQTLGNYFQMEWGQTNEPHAVAAYEILTGLVIQDCEFAPAPADTGLVTFGASPDGLVRDGDEFGSIEIKCPSNSVNHLKCFINDLVPEAHWPQIQGQLLATGGTFVDFISYDPRMPPHLQLFVKRCEVDLVMRENIITGIARMEGEIVQLLGKLPKAPQQEAA